MKSTPPPLGKDELVFHFRFHWYHVCLYSRFVSPAMGKAIIYSAINIVYSQEFFENAPHKIVIDVSSPGISLIFF